MVDSWSDFSQTGSISSTSVTVTRQVNASFTRLEFTHALAPPGSLSSKPAPKPASYRGSTSQASRTLESTLTQNGPLERPLGKQSYHALSKKRHKKRPRPLHWLLGKPFPSSLSDGWKLTCHTGKTRVQKSGACSRRTFSPSLAKSLSQTSVKGTSLR